MYITRKKLFAVSYSLAPFFYLWVYVGMPTLYFDIEKSPKYLLYIFREGALVPCPQSPWTFEQGFVILSLSTGAALELSIQ
jgi:hypothetical protein